MGTETKASETFWWSEDGRLSCLKQMVSAMITFLWVCLTFSALVLSFGYPKISFVFLYLCLISITVVWWKEMTKTEEWLGEHYGDWDE